MYIACSCVNLKINLYVFVLLCKYGWFVHKQGGSSGGDGTANAGGGGGSDSGSILSLIGPLLGSSSGSSSVSSFSPNKNSWLPWAMYI